MTNLLEQFKGLKLSRFEIVLQSQSEAVLPALIGSTLRGAFGHALKAISCSVEHQDCEKCFLSEVCLYSTVFEPTSSSKIKDIPRPFVFEPPIPPLTREISESQTLKLRIAEKGKISFGLTLIGETVKKLPYFIYAFELMARHGLGVNRQSFSVAEVFSIDANNSKHLIYTPKLSKILPFQTTNLAELVESRAKDITPNNSLKIGLQTPLRIRRNKELLENLSFAEFFKQCSLRLKFITENYGSRLEYDYQTLAKQSENVKTTSANMWRHGFSRRSNRQDNKYDLDGLLGEIEFAAEKFTDFLPLIIACEFLHIGSASNLGLGRFRIID
jgi:CRISPR-associated endoribonuclease Cas6